VRLINAFSGDHFKKGGLAQEHQDSAEPAAVDHLCPGTRSVLCQSWVSRSEPAAIRASTQYIIHQYRWDVGAARQRRVHLVPANSRTTARPLDSSSCVAASGTTHEKKRTRQDARNNGPASRELIKSARGRATTRLSRSARTSVSRVRARLLSQPSADQGQAGGPYLLLRLLAFPLPPFAWLALGDAEAFSPLAKHKYSY
jgi:hypothetical protein